MTDCEKTEACLIRPNCTCGMLQACSCCEGAMSRGFPEKDQTEQIASLLPLMAQPSSAGEGGPPLHKEGDVLSRSAYF
jgi:hypothetical protein